MFALRYYQCEARDGVYDAFDRHRSTAVVMPTATGKTELYLSLAVDEPGRVLVLVHRDYLITSPIRRLERAGFHDVSVEKGKATSERNGNRSKIVFASVQSIGPDSQIHRLQTFKPGDFSLLIVDEGHRATAQTYRNVLEYFGSNPKLKTLILTATPKRKDGVGLWNVCESIAYQMTPGRAASEGWIVPPRFFRRDVPEIDFSQVRMKGVDLDPDAMARAMSEEEPMHRVLAPLAEDRGPTIVFCPGVSVARLYAAVMDLRYRPGKAIAIYDGSPDEDVEKATRGLADGSIDYVFNVDKLTEGYDVPRVVRVAWAAPTASLVRWTQGCGRGFRPDASIAKELTGGPEDAEYRRDIIAGSVKPYCSIVTYYPSNCRHQICSAVDLLGGDELPPDVRSAAQQIQDETAKQAGGSDTQDDIETAQLFVDLRKAVEEKRRRIRAAATVVDEEYDGLGGPVQKLSDGKPARGDRADQVTASWGDGKIPSPQWKWVLVNKVGVPASVVDSLTTWRARVVSDLVELGVKVETALNYPKRQALKVRDELQKRSEQGVA